MKNIRKFIISLLLIAVVFIPVTIKAATASIKVTTNGRAIVGDTITATVTVSSSDSLGAWQFDVNYDSTRLQKVSGDSSIVYYIQDTKGVKSKSYTLKFKVLKSGSAAINIGSYLVWDLNNNQVKTTVGNATVKIMTQAELEATYSTNANLKSFGVDGYEISPAFDKDVLEYTLTVPNEIEKVNIAAVRADNTASVNGAGEKELAEGNNKFEIVVTAQKGNTKTYVINIERKELDPIYVEIDKVTYSLVRKANQLPELTGFTPSTVTINETEIPALYSEITKYTVVGVKDSDGNIISFIYNDGKYSQYNEIQTKGIKIFIRNGNKAVIPDGYKSCEITINDIKVTAYRLSDKSKQYLVYGVNVETGDEGLYVYDEELNSVISFDDEYTKKLDAKCDMLLYCCILFGGLFAIIFVVFIIFIIKSSKKSKKTTKKDKKKSEEKEMIA